MGNESILALPEGAGDFVVYYDARSKDLEACLEKRRRDVRTLAIEEAYTTKYSIHPGADTMLCGFRLTNRWLSMKKDIASCGMGGLSFEYGCASFEAWYGKECRLWVVEGLTLERCSTFGKKDKLEPSYVGPFEILGWIGPIVRLKIYVLWAEYRKLDWEFLFDELRVKVRWDSKRGPELTWERKDQMRSRELKRNGNVMVVNGSASTYSKSNWRIENESTVVSATSSKVIGVKLGVPDEEKDITEEKDGKDSDVDDEGDDHISDTQDADDEDVETKSDEDDIYKYKIRVYKDEDDEMINAEVDDSDKGVEEIIDAAMTDAKTTSEVKDDPKKNKLPPSSSSLSVFLGFGDQFLKLSSDSSLVSTVKDTTDMDIN
ncbi:hypothetical protein Tco_1256438 [Tanacetum coccineum]